MLKVDDISIGFQSLVAAIDIPSGTSLIAIEDNRKLPQPAWNTIQVSKSEHVVVENKLLHTNHCCREPTARFDFSRELWMLVSARNIKQGEWITYDYSTTEYLSGREFDCKCGAKQCRGRWKGFQSLAQDEKTEMIKENKVSSVVKILHEENA